MPSSFARIRVFSIVITSPREGTTGTPPRTRPPRLPFAGRPPEFKPRLASAESIRPVVLPSRRASSFAACSTSSSMLIVVLTHLMLTHHGFEFQQKLRYQPSREKLWHAADRL